MTNWLVWRVSHSMHTINKVKLIIQKLASVVFQTYLSISLNPFTSFLIESSQLS